MKFLLLLALLCQSSSPAPVGTPPFAPDQYQSDDGALLIEANGDYVEPYFATKALIVAQDAGLDVRQAAADWIRWALAHQKKDGRFERYCRKPAKTGGPAAQRMRTIPCSRSGCNCSIAWPPTVASQRLGRRAHRTLSRNSPACVTDGSAFTASPPGTTFRFSLATWEWIQRSKIAPPPKPALAMKPVSQQLPKQ